VKTIKLIAACVPLVRVSRTFNDETFARGTQAAIDLMALLLPPFDLAQR
jgi:hypothetical protein